VAQGRTYISCWIWTVDWVTIGPLVVKSTSMIVETLEWKVMIVETLESKVMKV